MNEKCVPHRTLCLVRTFSNRHVARLNFFKNGGLASEGMHCRKEKNERKGEMKGKGKERKIKVFLFSFLFAFFFPFLS